MPWFVHQDRNRRTPSPYTLRVAGLVRSARSESSQDGRSPARSTLRVAARRGLDRAGVVVTAPMTSGLETLC